VRLSARRPRRVVLSAISLAVTVTTIITVLAAQACLDVQQFGASSALNNPESDRINQVMLILTFVFAVLASIDVIFITWSTVINAKRQLAVSRALGATPGQVAPGLSFMQLFPALAGLLLGLPGGVALFAIVNGGNGGSMPRASWLIAVVVGTLIAVLGLTSVPVLFGTRESVATTLQSESI